MSILVCSVVIIVSLVAWPVSTRAQDLLQNSAKGDLDLVKAAIGQRADINVRGKKGQTPLMLASLNGHEAVVDLLITAGADVNLTAPFTPKLGIVDLSKKLGNCYTAATLAAISGHINILLKLLVSDSTDSASKCAPSGLFPLAVMGREGGSPGHRETALLLKPKDGHSPLAALLASIRGHDKLASELGIGIGPEHMTKNEAIEWAGPAIGLIHSYDELLDDLGAGDFWTAASRGNISRIDELLASGININAMNKFGETALIQAAAYADPERGIEVVRALLAKGATVDLKDGKGKTALARAQKRKEKAPEIVRLLKDFGGK